ncbi:MAG: alcohol dehydrogenase catalytic domain-containing protein [Gemmatimonadetes bacterium]|nr:alcohol dehydrogenase catalytic domain-containing protein [Gemmatimonadota bacterium]MBT6145468.1 alcohol dehydrogenase catalytic domain-containing protein [Gemmatimonadota bacterium]MBT7861974.1 alcohol dehydrogenase catalytic domain-containing protein [Gemmatimonadota bacterium]
MTAIAQIFDGPGQPFRREELPLPAPGAGERLVKLSLATLCGSDVHTVDGRRQEPTPAILGHEGIGIVTEAGAGVESDVGRRVTWSLADSCGHCRFCCAYDLPQKCDHLFKYGHANLANGSGLNGTYASHVLLRAGTHLVDVSASVCDAVAAPANCALATAVAAIDVLPSGVERVLVQGAGLLGLYATALLRHRGVESVWCCDPIAARRESIGHWDAEALTPEAATQLTDCDAVLEVSGYAGGVADGVGSLRTGGTYVFVGMVHPDSQLPLTGEQVIRKCLRIRGVHNYGPCHLDEGVRFLEFLGDDDRLQRLVSPPRPLAELANAFEEARQQQWLRVSITPDED